MIGKTDKDSVYEFFFNGSDDDHDGYEIRLIGVEVEHSSDIYVG